MVSRRSFLAGTGAVAAGLTFGRTAEAASGTLRFYNWDTYIGDSTLSGFKAATGVDVQMSLFATNDELYARTAGGTEMYDVIVPSCDFVTRMVEQGLLTKLDHSRLPNLKNISVPFLDPPYDPGCAHSVPFSWLVLGLGYRRSAMKRKKAPKSWEDVFDSKRYRIGWLTEPSDMIRLCAAYIGEDPNAITPKGLKKIEKVLTNQAKRGAVFHNDDGQDRLLARELDIVIEYNGDMAQVMKEDDDIGFVVPKEGSTRWVDCWAIPKTAPNPDGAYAFLDYMMSSDAGVDISSTIMYPTPNAAARALMPAEYRDNPVIFPPDAVLDKCTFAVKPAAAQQQAFEEIFARIRMIAGR
jgi:spermidine/putrescine transport system substrate-binding protein